MPAGEAPDGLLALLDLVPILVGLLLVGFGVVGLARTLPRLRRVRPADGVVVETRETGDGVSSGWWLLVAYRDADGREQRARWHGDSSADRTRYAAGTPVPVRYDPADPGWVWLPGGGRTHPALVPAVLVPVGLLVLVGSLLLGP